MSCCSSPLCHLPLYILKETYCAHVQVLNFYFGLLQEYVYTLWCSKNTSVFLSRPELQLCISPSVWNTLFVSLRPSLWKPNLRWLVISYTPSPILFTTTGQLCQISFYKPNHANVGHTGVVWCHRVTELKAGPLTRRFRSSVLCGREELLLTFLNFNTSYMQNNLHNTLRERGTKKAKKHEKSP